MDTITLLPGVDYANLGYMLDLIFMEYPGETDASKLSFLITDIFQVSCTKEDIISFRLGHEDIELQNRYHEHSLKGGLSYFE